MLAGYLNFCLSRLGDGTDSQGWHQDVAMSLHEILLLALLSFSQRMDARAKTDWSNVNRKQHTTEGWAGK